MARAASNASSGWYAVDGVRVSPGATDVTAIPSPPSAAAGVRPKAVSAPLLVM
ncbi:hypothetical protein [Streptomyces sp. NPDC101455]|uniref:hypothetical protein n=1 Tax=Streptomyces sp. NPDC101455 TaxID=3366142 RepID=UPI0038144CAF